MSEETMNIFCTTYNLHCLIHVPSSFRNVEDPNCIDITLSNNPYFFKNTSIIETDFHNATFTTMEIQLPKAQA